MGPKSESTCFPTQGRNFAVKSCSTKLPTQEVQITETERAALAIQLYYVGSVVSSPTRVLGRIEPWP